MFEPKKGIYTKVAHSIRDFIECCEKWPLKKPTDSTPRRMNIFGETQ